MDVQIAHPDFVGRGLAFRVGRLLRGHRLLLDGNEIDIGRDKIQIRGNSGESKTLQLKFSFLDPIPRVEIDGESIAIAPCIKWFEYVWMGVPICLIFEGGLIGGLIGFSAMFSSFQVFRSQRSYASKLGISTLISLASLVVYLVVAFMIGILIECIRNSAA